MSAFDRTGGVRLLRNGPANTIELQTSADCGGWQTMADQHGRPLDLTHELAAAERAGPGGSRRLFGQLAAASARLKAL